MTDRYERVYRVPSMADGTRREDVTAEVERLRAERDEAIRIAGVMERSSMAATQHGWDMDRRVSNLEAERDAMRGVVDEARKWMQGDGDRPGLSFRGKRLSELGLERAVQDLDALLESKETT